MDVMTSLTRFLNTVAELIESRGRLAAAELEAARGRLVFVFAALAAAVFLGALALVFGTLSFVLATPPEDRAAVLAWIAGFYSLAAIAIITTVAIKLRHGFRLFAATMEELRRDKEVLLGEKALAGSGRF